MTRQNFINLYYPHAVKATAGTGLFPETLITQLIGESGYTLSQLATRHFNFFGIKAMTNAWRGRVVSMTTREYNANGTSYMVNGTNKVYANRTAALADGANNASLFRVYSGIEDGFKGWVTFLQQNQRYARAGVFTAKTPQEQFQALRNAGYATSPTYVSYLTSIFNGLRNLFTAAAANLTKNNGAAIWLIAAATFFF